MTNAEREAVATFIAVEKSRAVGLERQHVSFLHDLGYTRAEAAECIGPIVHPRSGKDVLDDVLDDWWDR
jgi:hypothetical protein